MILLNLYSTVFTRHKILHKKLDQFDKMQHIVKVALNLFQYVGPYKKASWDPLSCFRCVWTDSTKETFPL